MDYTNNLHLPQFEETDRIHHDDFNDAFATVDAALAEKPFVIGTYTGDGKMEADGGLHVTLGFRPRFVVISAALDADYPNGGSRIMMADGQTNPYLTITDSGFTVKMSNIQQNSYYIRLNTLNKLYGYIAFR